MIIDARKYRKEDEEVKKYYTARSMLEQYCYELIDQYEPETSVYKKAIDVIDWLNNCFRPDKAQFVQAKKTLDALIMNAENKTINNDDGEPPSKRNCLPSMK